MNGTRENKNPARFSIGRQRLYPHLKLTSEKFPRLLVTRLIDGGDAEYYGAFLPETGIRFLIDFLNKTFRLRSCEIEIDGQFAVPCTQFYRKRCVAPCVESLCDAENYDQIVEMVRLFLRRDATGLEEIFLRKIESAAETLDFEKAGEWRDLWQSIAQVFNGKDWNLWLDDAVDTFEMAETEENLYVYLVTLRGRKTLGKRVFVFDKTEEIEEVFAALLPQLYRFYAPKEIRVTNDFPERKIIAEKLSGRFGRPVKIVVLPDGERKVMTERALRRTKFEFDFKNIRRDRSTSEIQAELKRTFGLRRKPKRIEGFDVAHISGSDFVAAKSVWADGRFVGREYEFWFSDEKSELETLRKFIEYRFSADVKTLPDLIVIDGGRAHLQAALQGLQDFPDRKFAVIAAVKPPHRHSEIAHFITKNGARIEFVDDSEALRVLQSVRDEAHALSNQIHRERREMGHFYQPAAVLPSLDEKQRRQLLVRFGSLKNVQQLREADLKELFETEQITQILRDLKNYDSEQQTQVRPLIVPIRFDDENGDAQDLRPLTTYK